MRAFVFPGQGSQAIGMGKELAENFTEAKLVFEEVDAALGQNLSSLMWNGPEGELTLTENAQPALMSVSVAVIRVLESRGYDLTQLASFVAGHSLGEYSALAASSALTLSDTAKLLKLRGQAMQRAVPVGAGAMAAILGLEFDDCLAIAQEASSDGDVCAVANDNSPGQVVLSGSMTAVALAMDIAKQKGAKRALELPVSAPFHCSLMQPAAEEMRAALATCEISVPCLPLITNISAQPVVDPEEIRRLLVEQVTGVVRWRESVKWLADQGVTQLVEAGSGKVLTGMAKRIDDRLRGVSISSAATLMSFIETEIEAQAGGRSE